MSLNSNCKICNHHSDYVFKKQFLQKYEISFFKCMNCGFLQTEKPFWLDEAYRVPFTPLDLYLVSRPIELGKITENIIFNYFDYSGRFLDYGGGIGFFSRMMRDKGFQFFRQDKYAQNLFAQYFDIEDIPEDNPKFELLTSFEVLEHLENPLDELDQMFSLSDSVLCSTLIQPDAPLDNLRNWFYLAELHGQHISFYTSKSLEIIAERYNCFYYSNELNIHLFTPKPINQFTFEKIRKNRNDLALRIRNRLFRAIDQIFQPLLDEEEGEKPLNSLIKTDEEWVIQKLKQEFIKEKHI